MRPVFLIGFMGCGKSTVGKEVAKALNCGFIDLDIYIQEKTGKTIPEIFEQIGETEFRLMEKDALREVAALKNTVIATGGGVPCFYDNISLMNKSGLTIYLKLSPAELFKRLTNERDLRPLIANKNDDELLQFIEIKLTEREVFYNQALVVIDAETAKIEDYISISFT